MKKTTVQKSQATFPLIRAIWLYLVHTDWVGTTHHCILATGKLIFHGDFSLVILPEKNTQKSRIFDFFPDDCKKGIGVDSKLSRI